MFSGIDFICPWGDPQSPEDVENVITRKIGEAIGRTNNNKERLRLIELVLISAKRQMIIQNWRCDVEKDHFLFDIQLSFPMYPRFLIQVPMVEE